MRTYELMCIVQPELDEEGVDALNARIADVITSGGGEVISVEILGRRRLAFPIRKKTEGVYVLTYASMDNACMAELGRRLRLSEEVIRHLIVRPDEDEIPMPGTEDDEKPQGEDLDEDYDEVEEDDLDDDDDDEDDLDDDDDDDDDDDEY